VRGDRLIQALACTPLTASQHRDCTLALEDRDIIRIVDGALVRHRPTAKERREARARCLSLVASRRAVAA
jgi:hypothetical protein